MQRTNTVRRFWRAGAIALCLALFGGTQPPETALAEPATAPPGSARVWIYRDYEPYQSLATPYVRMNGAIVGISQPGAAFSRDVSPGTYLITVDSEGEDVYQFAQVALAPAQTVYVKIETSKWWWSGGKNFARDTFYTRVIDAKTAQAEIVAKQPVPRGS
jgi:hypothetical protein